jgi:hypothetical protein
VGFEHKIPVFERAKTVHALDHAATVIGLYQLWRREKSLAPPGIEIPAVKP